MRGMVGQLFSDAHERAAWRNLGAQIPLLLLIVWVVSSATADAKPVPSSVKLVGASCDKPLQVFFSRSARGLASTGKPYGVHPFDDKWIHVAVSSSADVWSISWSLAPGIALCPGGYTRFGFGSGHKPISSTTGSVSQAVSGRAPVQAKVKARFIDPIVLRDDLGAGRLKNLVDGWTKRSCTIRASAPEASELLRSLAERAGAHGCIPPKGQVHVSSTELLRHLSAYFNAKGKALVNRRLPDTTVLPSFGNEYYRVLRQLTSF